MRARITFFLFICILFFNKTLLCTEYIRKICTVVIPEAPEAYNASFIEYEEGYLMAFRYDRYRLPIGNFLKDFHQNIGLVKLDNKFHPVGTPTFCKILGNRAYDPRICRIGDEIHLIFASARPQDIHSCLGSQLNLAKIYEKDGMFIISRPLFLYKNRQNKFEKNWVPFDYNGELYLSYTIRPHHILLPTSNGTCLFLYETSGECAWHYGEIRGGTPAVQMGDEYLAFFHSSCMDPKSKCYTYYMGAYTFEAAPPFRVTKMSPEPIKHEDFYSTTPVPLTTSRVIFPSGLVLKEDSILISYGENDGAIKIMDLDKKLLYESLLKIEHLEENNCSQNFSDGKINS